MFTGIIEEVGRIAELKRSADAATVVIRAHTVLQGVQHGDSIAVDGVCLTVIASDAGSFTADVMGETLNRSTIGTRTPGDRVNLERAARVGDRLSGHIVQGHVDATATVLDHRSGQHWDVVRIALPDDVAPLIVEKGSIAVNGVSLTVSARGESWFEVSLIPETLRATNLGDAAAGDVVNLETDVLARHVRQLLASTREVTR